MHKPPVDMLYVSFNQDQSCFSVGTQTGFQVWDSDPLQHHFTRELGGGIGIVEMLFRSNILALVGGGENPAFATDRVMIWDDHERTCFNEYILSGEVKAVRLRRDRVIVALENKIVVYDFSINHIATMHTTPNPHGLLAIANHNDHFVLACPGEKQGLVHIEHFDANTHLAIQVHTSAVRQLALNQDGSRLATTSTTGTLVRIWDTNTGEKLAEVRRGSSSADITNLSFRRDAKWLCLNSEHGTLHLFGASDKSEGTSALEVKKTRSSSLRFLGAVLPEGVSSWLESDWSYTQVHGVDPHAVCGFGMIDPNTIIVLGTDRIWIKYKFDASSGSVEKIAQKSFNRTMSQVDSDKEHTEGSTTHEPNPEFEEFVGFT